MFIGSIGCPFSHDVSSCHGYSPKNFKWMHNTICPVQIFFEPSYNIYEIEKIKSKKFLWLCESKEIYFPIYEDILNNLNSFKSKYIKIFTHDRTLLTKDEIFEYCPPASNKSWIRLKKLYHKTKLYSMIGSGKNKTTGHKFRNNLMNFFKDKKIPVDLYGKNIKSIKNKETAFADYFFSFVVENGKYSNYYTEKIMDCFATGTIPIYHGSPEIIDFFNKDGIILLEDKIDFSMLTEDYYHSRIHAIVDNFEREQDHQIADDYLYDKIIKFI
jgi:hypothetical protein